MFLKLLIAFTVVPTVELYLLFRLAELLGAFETVMIVLITGSVGAALAKREGFSVLRQLAEESQRGFPSGDRILEGVLVLIGGCLLLTPGVLTDLAGFSMIFPLTRRLLAPALKGWAMKRVKIQSAGPGGVVFGGEGFSGGFGHPRPVDPDRPEVEIPRGATGGGGGRFDHPTS